MRLFNSDRFAEIADTITRNKSRSLLTGFGIFWGVFMLLVMNGSDASVEAALQPILKQQAKAAQVKSRNLTTAGIDLIVELRPNDPPALVQACAALPGVQSVSLLDHDGQIRY